MWLLEATAHDIKTDIKTVSEKLVKTLDTFSDKIENIYKKPIDPAFKTKFENILKQVETSKDRDRPEQLKQNVQQFLDLIRNEYPGGSAKFNAWVKSKASLARVYNELDLFVTSPTSNDPEKEISIRDSILRRWPMFTDFMKDFFIISDFGMHKVDVTRAEDIIKKLKENLKALDTAIEAYTAVYKSDAAAKSDAEVQIPDTEAVQFEDFKSKLTNINTALEAALKTQLKDATKELTKANDVIEEALNGIKQLTKNKELELATKKFDNNLKYGTKSTKKDWDTLLKNDSSKTMWDAYYTEVWGRNAETIRDLGRAFTNEVRTLGFSNRKNFFIDFILNWIIPGKLHLSPQDYAAVHNAVARGYLTENMLRRTVNDGTTFTNIVFSNDLYKTASIVDLMEYFRLQSEALKASAENNFSQPLLKDKYNAKDAWYLRDLFFRPGNSIAATQEYIEGNVENGRIKPLNRIIKEMTVAGIKTELNQNDNGAKTAFSIDAFINRLPNTFKATADTISKVGAVKLIYYIIDTQTDKAAKAELIKAFNKPYSNYSTLGLSRADTIDCKYVCDQFDLAGTTKATDAINAILSRTSKTK